ncbi:ferritin-like domain-containing protein [Pedobacter aquatilis]|uniref:ferritin-like domain-containing protein n=1 Tax=Pedobacter aquatilis TaxID=351343 RepID=UPI002930EF40|nr:ferritin-like domain-containing protein [Pedobacter aquatilis]
MAIKQSGGDPKFATKTTAQELPALKELFKDGIADLYWAENHLTKALPKMISAASAAPLQKAISKHLEETLNHVSRLEKIFELLAAKPLAKKCDAMEGLTKEAEGIVEQTPPGSATRDVGIILASQKVEHYEIASYRGLQQLAYTMGLEEIAGLLAQTLEEEKNADSKLTDIAQKDINYQAGEEA